MMHNKPMPEENPVKGPNLTPFAGDKGDGAEHDSQPSVTTDQWREQLIKGNMDNKDKDAFEPTGDAGYGTRKKP